MPWVETKRGDGRDRLKEGVEQVEAQNQEPDGADHEQVAAELRRQGHGAAARGRGEVGAHRDDRRRRDGEAVAGGDALAGERRGHNGAFHRPGLQQLVLGAGAQRADDAKTGDDHSSHGLPVYW